jgi:hypothetical protein
MPTAPSTPDTGERVPSLFGWLKFWRKPEVEPTERDLANAEVKSVEDLYVELNKAILSTAEGSSVPNRNNGQFAIDLMSVFLHGGEIPSDVYFKREKGRGGDFSYPPKRLPGLESREYSYEATGLNHVALAPRSATFMPPRLTAAEKSAIQLVELVEGVKLKPSLRKKVKEVKKGQRRVVFDADGKMREVVTK